VAGVVDVMVGVVDVVVDVVGVLWGRNMSGDVATIATSPESVRAPQGQVD
jgi:hypothetical protein